MVLAAQEGHFGNLTENGIGKIPRSIPTPDRKGFGGSVSTSIRRMLALPQAVVKSPDRHNRDFERFSTDRTKHLTRTPNFEIEVGDEIKIGPDTPT